MLAQTRDLYLIQQLIPGSVSLVLLRCMAALESFLQIVFTVSSFIFLSS